MTDLQPTTSSDSSASAPISGEGWVALLAHAVEFAKRSVALPEGHDRERWQAALPSIITLQAVCLALAELPRLDGPHRAVGCDRADLLIAEHASQISSIWRSEPMSAGLLELMRDARSALEAARSLCWVWTAASDGFVMQAVATRLERAREGGLVRFAMALEPETTTPVGVPVLCLGPEHHGIELPGATRSRIVVPAVQWYAQADGSPLIAPLAGELPAGRPMLELLVDEGEPTRALRRTLGDT